MSESNQVVSTQQNSIGDLMFNAPAMQSMMKLAEIMAKGVATVPKHLQGQTSDCLAIIMQAQQWGMLPFVVAQKTHLVNGTLGYEAQLVNAVIQSSGAIRGRFHYEYKGDGNEMECRVGAIINGEENITWGEWLKSSTVTTKNSPLWKTNPKQQIGYLQVKNWARMYCPSAILGAYTADELQGEPTPKPMTEVIDLPIYTETQVDSNIAAWRKGLVPVSAIINRIKREYVVSDAIEKYILDNWEEKPVVSVDVETGEVDYESQLIACTSNDQLIETWLSIPDEITPSLKSVFEDKQAEFM